MSPVPFRQQPAFRALLFAIILAATWVYDFFFQGGSTIGLGSLILDLVLVSLLLQACLFFYAQFVLPVHSLEERLSLWKRLLLHARGAHGPATFIQNGRRIERRGESARRGPGLVWIDSASAAMTRSNTGPKRVVGPGIHFLEDGEQVGATFSLHTQTATIGPGQNDPIFEKLPADASEDVRRRHASMQARRQMVTGLTRDGNEVVPEIRVTFRLDGAPARSGFPGSRFGFMREAVERAARAEGLNVDPVSARRSHVAWNQLPGLIAVDLWREYLAKFTLDELFSARFAAVPDVLQPEERMPAETFPVKPMSLHRDWPTRMMLRLNSALEDKLALHQADTGTAPGQLYPPRVTGAAHQVPGQQYTALQIIAHMVSARMTQAAVPILDECGRCLKGHVVSEEYKRLKERGLLILNVTLGGYRFDPAVETQIVQQWRTAWLSNANSERVHVEQLEVLAAESGRQRALLEHAKTLGTALRSAAPASIPEAAKVLVQASRDEILTDERLHGTGSAELSSLTDLAQWVERPDND